ncbi:MAG TPA: Rid family detoxifying hydrolase [Limnochordia bacterium]|nr:Rid family detoxifying hydrolase [Limnochordia bacterium]
MPKEVILTDNAPKPGGAYSQGLKAGGFVFVAGQGPADPRTGKVAESIEEQTEQTINNVEAILKAGGATLADVVKCTVHLSDLALFQRFNAVYGKRFPDPKPTRTTVGSQLNNILVEIDCMAYVGDK